MSSFKSLESFDSLIQKYPRNIVIKADLGVQGVRYTDAAKEIGKWAMPASMAIYDFSQEEDINKVLRKLSLKAQKNFFLITKGDRVDYLMKNKLTNTWKMFMNFESSHLKIYTPKMLVKEKV